MQFDFDLDKLRSMMAAGIERFYVYYDTDEDEAFEFTEETELREWLGLRKTDDLSIHCFIPCVHSSAHNLSRRKNPVLFNYNGDETVESVIANFQNARDKFRGLGFAEEAIMVGNNFIDGY